MTQAPPTLFALEEQARALLFTEARTANTFADTPVTDEELSAIWELARWSPSAANTQPLRVLFVRTEEGKARLIPHLAEGNRAKAAGAPVVAVMAYDLDFHEHMPTVFPARGEQMRENLGGQPQLREGMARQSASLQTGVFLLAVRAAGLSAGPMGGFDAAGIDAEFFAGTTWRSHLVVNIGHPGVDPWFPRLPRLEHEQVLAWA
ncbi:malonic semialdehyde reductase [Nocardioides sp. zg-DK7169]|uniref:malonic semialdehyde reductase n=1 Tax=Nocardioides sp. zg-DK7169 TaxID=2736600 RepID=UPI0015566425|nr:malonic semialdehyde reductase [Nocardioides sp. zg-DK7169]NPC98734.1 malonic semialdehyde reductase [Nocardioides sp. zg-DK7169]